MYKYAEHICDVSSHYYTLLRVFELTTLITEMNFVDEEGLAPLVLKD